MKTVWSWKTFTTTFQWLNEFSLHNVQTGQICSKSELLKGTKSKKVFSISCHIQKIPRNNLYQFFPIVQKVDWQWFYAFLKDITFRYLTTFNSIDQTKYVDDPFEYPPTFKI